jgi:hypothetical protein
MTSVLRVVDCNLKDTCSRAYRYCAGLAAAGCDFGQELTAAREARPASMASDTELADRIRFLIGAAPG